MIRVCRNASAPLAFLLAAVHLCQGAAPVPDDFTELTLEELSQIQVTSIARKHGSLFDTPAAAYVLTSDDIHRAGTTDLASTLRGVPGLQVGQIDSFNYAISARGLNDATSSKLLVLMDGRSLYSQTFSGAYWNYHALMFEDIDRVETIRGPGASLWGANAMNGVINIVSKSAFSTQGSLVSASRGDRLDALVALRHGWQFGAATAVRVYGRVHDEGDYGRFDREGVNGWKTRLAGTRLDWKRPGGGGLMVMTEFREQRLTSLTRVPTLLPPFADDMPDRRFRRGGHVLGRWRQPVAGTGELTVQASYERLKAADLAFGESHHILDSDLQLSLRPFRGHDLLAGVSARRDADRLISSPRLTYSPATAATTFLGAFIQDEITVVPRRLAVTVGSKMERNTFTGWELQPGVRALWSPTSRQRIWAAVSRAARTPSRAERAITWFAAVQPPTADVPLPTAFIAQGSPTFDSEHLTAFELGHRVKVTPRLTIATDFFLNRYRDVRSLRATLIPFKPVPSPHATFIMSASNSVEGDTLGGEIIVRWRVNPALYLEASASTLRYNFRDLSTLSEDPLQLSVPGLVGSTPREEYKFRGNWDITDDWSLDLLARHVGALPQQGIPSYEGLDLHLSWRPRHEVEIELILRNALDPRHPEAPPLFLGGGAREIPRSFHLRVTYRR